MISWPRFLLRELRGHVRSLRHSLATRAWIARQRRKGCSVSWDIELTGLWDLDRIELAPCLIERQCVIWLCPDAACAPRLTIGARVYLGRNCYLGVGAPLSIGPMTQIGAYSYVISATHNIGRRDVPMIEQGFACKPVNIGSDVWIGTHVVILQGVTVGDGAVVGANSVVTSDVSAGAIVAGTPARALRTR